MLVCALFLGLALLPRASAQSADSDQTVKLDPFKITASSASGYNVQDASSSSRINLPYIDVPQTITVITNEQMEDMHITVSRDVLAWTQSAVAGANGSALGSFTVRGLTVSQAYRDGFQVSTARDDRDPALYDRIELVSGPASAAIGRGQAGGLINYVTKKPVDRDFANFTFTVGTDNYTRFEADYNKSYGKISVRLPAYIENGDGTYGGSLNHNRKYGAGPSVLWNISSSTQLLVNVSAWRNEGPALSSESDYLDTSGTLFQLRQSIGQYVGSAWNPAKNPYPSKSDQAWGYSGGGNDDNVGELSAILTSKLTDRLELRLGLFADGAQDLFRFFQKSPNTSPDPADPTNFLQPLNYLENFYNSMQARDQGDLLYNFDFHGTSHKIDVGYDAFDLRSDSKSGQTSAVNGVALTDQFYNPTHTPPPGFDPYTSAQLTAKSITRQKGIGYYVQYLGSFFSDHIMVNAGVRQDNTETRTTNTINNTAVLNAAQVTHAPRYSITYKPIPSLSMYYLKSYQEDPPATTLQYSTFQASGGAVLPPAGDPRYSAYITGQTKAALDEWGLKGNFFNNSITATFDYYHITQNGALASTPVNDPSQATPAHPQALLVWSQTYLTQGVVYYGYEMAVSGHVSNRLTFTAMYNIPMGRTLFNGVLAPGAALIRTAKLFGKYNVPLADGTGLDLTLGFRDLLGNWTIRSNSAVKMLHNQDGVDFGVDYYWHHRRYDVGIYGHNLTDSPQWAGTNNNVELRRFYASFSAHL